MPSAGPLLEAMARKYNHLWTAAPPPALAPNPNPAGRRLQLLSGFGGTLVTGPLGLDQEMADAFTFDDPSGKFPDEVGLRVGTEGVQVLDRTGRDHLVNMPERVIRTWSWKKITHVRVSHEHGSEVLFVYIRGMSAHGFEMEDTEAFREHFERYQKWHESGAGRERAVGDAEQLQDAVRQARAYHLSQPRS